ncbi:AraC family transcriptional regulator [Mucilaginibacter rubeus]|uniref:AraC family transcriptional regulator n=1 Tax=Mucilaginibacter rubeus TaxID=2027860 RepID=A0A5C1I565_9SPHI|nr:AraC family transcriptional regulator [Mucilaginibacter rubeus]QEM13257.1 AraC family transcriptional regulator [Mucilaginibacter rubeus]
MVKDNLYQPFEIVLREPLEACPRNEHSHSFFEFIYIVSGTGKQCINNSKFTYKAGHLFLLTPNDSHYFEIATLTQFLFIRFNMAYIKDYKLPGNAVKHLEFILKNAAQAPGCVLKNQEDSAVVKPIMQAIISEHQKNGLYSKELLQQYINTVIVIVARNVAMSMPDEVDENTEEKVLDILQYIQTNIYSPEKLRVDVIADKMGVSETYAGRYFKKHTNETLQQYIIKCKLKLIENRLLHSNMRMVEIANELGFNDESHLNRIFKKYRHVNPSEFRKIGGESSFTI